MSDIGDMNYAMTNFDIKDIYPRLPVIKYPELANYRDIHHLTNNPYNSAIILVVHTTRGPNGSGVAGHWILVFMDKQNDDVYCFDSYGKYPDNHIVELGHDRCEFNENELHLSRMLMNDNSIRRIIYNNNKYQGDGYDVATCGKWACWRLMMYLAGMLDERQFKRLVNEVKKKRGLRNNDEVVNLIFQ